MQFTVPQFIEHDPKIVGPLTFRQFIFLGIAAAICFIFWFAWGKTHFFSWILVTIIMGIVSVALAFLRPNGRPLPAIIADFFNFSFGTKIYLWRKKDMPLKMMKRTEPEKTGPKEPKSLKFAEKSRLKKLSTQIETK